MSQLIPNGHEHYDDAEVDPKIELNQAKALLKEQLVFIELKEEVQKRLELPPNVPVLKADLEREIAGGQIPPAAIAAGVEALKILQPAMGGYERFMARYYLLEGERFLTAEERDDFQAQRYFRKALDLDQQELSAEAAFYLAALVRVDDAEGAVKLYRRSIELNDAAPATWFELGRLLRERRDLPGALSAFEAAYRLNPTSANLLNEVGETHLMANDLFKAQASFLHAMELEPEVWILPIKLGTVEYTLQQYPQAIKHLRTGLDLSPEELVDGHGASLYIEGLYTLGLAYRESGKPEQARKLFKAVLTLSPVHEGAIASLS